MPEVFGVDAYSPDQIAERVEQVGVKKARLHPRTTVALGVLGGGFIGLGAMLYTFLVSDPAAAHSPPTRFLGGFGFSVGLILVVVAGAELFTGNNLLVMAWAGRKISTLELLRNWLLVFLANLIGAVGLAALISLTGSLKADFGAAAVRIAETKSSLTFLEGFSRGILCNVFVCLAVWLAMAGRTVTDKILAIVLPVTAFVALGFEHSIANLYLFSVAAPLTDYRLNWTGIGLNLASVTLGNIVGGAGMVALVYHLVYRHSWEPVTKSPMAGSASSRIQTYADAKPD